MRGEKRSQATLGPALPKPSRLGAADTTIRPEPAVGSVRDTLRDSMIGVGTAVALFAAFQLWTNGQSIA